MRPKPVPDIHSDTFLRSLMRRQLLLSVSCASAFLVLLLGLPLANHLFPELMARRVLGFTITWLLLGVAFFPTVWLVAWVFVRCSIALEQREVAETREGGRT
jgi:uncharacterized membrane protein (DUF485 family)